MGNLVERLREYFAETPKNEILKSWEKSLISDSVGPTVVEYFENIKYWQLKGHEPISTNFSYETNDINPEYTSGFFLI